MVTHISSFPIVCVKMTQSSRPTNQVPSCQHSVQQSIKPSSKTPPSFLPSPTHKNLETSLALPFFGKSSLYIGFSGTTLLKIRFFSEPPYYENFSPLTPSYLLKVAEFFVKISQLKFLLITEKNIFVYKVFCH